MTAKRFTITQDFEEHHRQIRDNGKIIMGCFVEPQAEPIVKLLNELHEENQSSKEFIEQLQEELVLFKNAGADMGIDLNNQITALKKENEQLKQKNRGLQSELHIFKEDVTHSNKIIDKLNDENEQLRKDVARYRGNFREMEDVKCELAEENKRLKNEIETYKSGNALLKKTLDKEWK